MLEVEVGGVMRRFPVCASTLQSTKVGFFLKTMHAKPLVAELLPSLGVQDLALYSGLNAVAKDALLSQLPGKPLRIAKKPPDLYFATPAAIVGSVKRWLANKGDEPTYQRLPLASIPGETWQLQERDPQLEKMLLACLGRFNLRSLPDGKQRTDKDTNPIVATHAGTGCGKSRFADAVLALMEDRESVRKQMKGMDGAKDFCALLKHNVSIGATFGGSTSIEDGERDPVTALARRVLFAYFRPAKTSWDDFLEMCRTASDKLSLDAAVEAVRQDYRARKGLSPDARVHVTLAVDELVKSVEKVAEAEKEWKRRDLVTAIGELLSADRDLDALVTTLDIKSVTLRTSGRPFVLIALPPLSMRAVDALFPRSSEPGAILDSDPVRLVIAQCSGHPRTLETLHGYLRSKGTSSVPEVLAKAALEVLVSSAALSIPFDALQTAILGTTVGPDEALMDWDGSPTRFTPRQLIISGALKNSLVSEGMFVPEVPFVALLSCLRGGVPAHLSGKEPASSRFLAVAKHLEELCFIPTKFRWEDLERFHARFECLRSIMRGPGHRASLERDYFGLRGGRVVASPNFKPSAMSYTATWHSELTRLDHQYPRSAPTASTRAVSFRSVDSGTPVSDVLVPAKNNPGFDLCRFEWDGDVPLAILVECKWSDHGTSTKLTLGEVREKHKLMRKAFRIALKDQAKVPKGLTESGVFLVFVAMRELSSDIQPAALPDNCIVLDRKAALALYGRTLASRPQFIADLLDRAAASAPAAAGAAGAARDD